MADFANKQELYDYIQKEKVREQSRTRLPGYERGVPDACYEMLDKVNEFYAKQLACTIPKVYISTDLQPTVDTERHAHWIKEKVEDITYPWYRRFCSNCKMHSPLGLEHNYCPNCGCKMDEDRNESRNR